MIERVLRMTSLFALLALVAAAAAGARAGGNGTVTITQHGHNDVYFSESVVNPCTGSSGTVTAVAAN